MGGARFHSPKPPVTVETPSQRRVFNETHFLPARRHLRTRLPHRADRSDDTDKYSPARRAGLFVFVATSFAAKHSLPKRADVARPTAPSHTSPLRPNFPPRLDENTDKDLFPAPDRRQHRQSPFTCPRQAATRTNTSLHNVQGFSLLSGLRHGKCGRRTTRSFDAGQTLKTQLPPQNHFAANSCFATFLLLSEPHRQESRQEQTGRLSQTATQKHGTQFREPRFRGRRSSNQDKGCRERKARQSPQP